MDACVCPKCGSRMSVKDCERFCSLLCECRIIIYYYDSCYDIVITKEEYLRDKRKKTHV